jgi:predicted TIM-barrel fold metal-dependent hydrolase
VRIDVHAHYFPVEYLERIDRYVGGPATAYLRRNKLVATGPRDLEAQLRLMDRAKVDMQILSISSLFPYFAGESDASNTARFANDIYQDIVREYPQRFAAFACTPLPHIQASIDEMRRALDDLGMVGVTAGTTVVGRSIADPAFVEFWTELNRRKAVLFVHPMGASVGSEAIEASKLTWPIGAPLEDTICMLQFMQAQIPKRFPDVKIILPHLGGFAPFLMARLDELRDRFLPESAALPSVQARSFWYDTVNANPWALRCTRETVGSERLLVGSDYPFWVDDAFLLAVDYVKQANLPASEVDLILGGNAEQLLGLPGFVAAC